MDSGLLPIGRKQGCYTIIGGFDVYQEEVVRKKILRLELEKQMAINGEQVTGNNFESVDTYDEWIQDYKTTQKYKCQCKCGKINYLDETALLRKKHRDCGEDCELRQERLKKRLASYPREKDKSYYVDFSNTIHESLEILECINDNYEGTPQVYDKRKKGAGICKVFKLYRCRCQLCGHEYQFKSSDFLVKKDSYGCLAGKGYYSIAHCDCHPISSFQWRTIKIFKEYNLSYKVEVSFPELYGAGQTNLLRYDFAVFNSDNSIKWLIECQGEQHYKPIPDFGGTLQYKAQVKNDGFKRAYAEQHDIHLIEIPYTCNTYEKEVEFLKSNKVIN